MLLSLLLLCSIAGVSQSAETADTGGRVVLVLPFDNRSGQAALAWVGDSFPDTLNQRLTSAGFLTITREDRQYALDHLGLPIDFRPSRATTIRIAQNLDADFVIVGSFNVINGRIAVQAQVLEVKNLRLSAPLQDSSELNRLFDVENAIAWKVARQIDPHFNVAQQTFLAASGGVQLSAFENYIRGTDAPTSQERVKRLQAAIAANPNYPAALLALGKAQYAEREYDQAAATFAKIPRPTGALSKQGSISASPASTPPSTPRPNQPSPSSPAGFRSPRSSTIRPSPPAVRATTPFLSFSALRWPIPTTRTTTTTSPSPYFARATSQEPSAKWT
ncbi:tetratricopeptide repeat protein [Tunturiibacter empetritectus]|uniref:tetratricopeptide repeat protein n=1 Tax=Tunturiibacter empetritectus TaxID=3069691 RepID=UPI003D9B176C